MIILSKNLMLKRIAF